MTKQLMIIYDKECKESATLLYNLLSQHSNIRASTYTYKEIQEQKFVSREKCLYIGNECSSSFQFDDRYHELGIHIGYIGAKAWIRCSRYQCDVPEFKKFESMLENFTQKFKLRDILNNYIKNDRNRVLPTKDKPREFHFLRNQMKLARECDNNNCPPQVFVAIAIIDVIGNIAIWYSESRKKKRELVIPFTYQYIIGILSFYEKHLNDFLEISGSGDFGTVQEESVDNDEKKKENLEAISEGIDFFLTNISSFEGALANDRQGGEYLKKLSDKIIEFQKEINAYQNNNNPNAHGYIAETWHKFTLEIDALAKRTGDTAFIPPAQDFASVDVQGSWGEGYQLKYCNDAWKSAKEQSTTYFDSYRKHLYELRKKGKDEISIEEYLKQKGVDPDIDIHLPVYEAQTRLLPTDQLPDAKIALQKRINKELNNLANPNRAAQAKRYQDVLTKLSDHVESPNGAKSMPLSYEECKTLQTLAKEGNFDPARFDTTLAKKADYIYLTHSTINAGLNGAIYSALFKALPFILDSLTALVKDGRINREQIDDLSKAGVIGGTQGFIQGFSTAMLSNCCILGYFGEELQSAALQDTPQFKNAIILIVTTTVETFKDTIKMTNGEMNLQVFTQRLEKRLFISSFSYVCGAYVQGVMSFAPVLGYQVGSFMGSILGNFVFEAKEKVFMSICVHSGFSFFGMVEQDYELPPKVKQYLGIESMNKEQITIEKTQIEDNKPEQMTIEAMTFEKMDITYVKRGVVGIRKIGYIAIDA